MTLGSIVVRLSMATADFETDAGRAAKIAQKRAQEIDAAFRKAGAVIGVALGAAAVTATAAIRETINRMDDLSKSAQRVGMPTEDFSRLAYAGELADVSMESLVGSLGKLTKAQAAALKDTSEQARVFDALGISVKNADGSLRSSNDVLLDFADRFKAMEGSPEIMAAGFSLFGRSFQELIPLLKDGSGGLRDAAAESDALGKTLSAETGRAAEEFNDNITRLQTAIGGAWMEIAQGMLPNLNKLTGELVSAAKETDNLRQFGDGLATVLGAIGSSFSFVAGMARQFGVDMATAIEAASGWAEITKNIASLGIADGTVAGGFGRIQNAKKTRAQMMADAQRDRAAAAAAANIDRLIAGGTGSYSGPLLAPSKFEQDAANAAKAQADALRKALGGPAGGGKSAARGGKSDVQRQAEEAARAAKEAADAQARWHGTIMDMEATLAGPMADAQREYERNVAQLNADYAEGHVTLADYARGLDAYAASRDKELEAIKARKTPAEEMLADMEFERQLIGKTREEQELLTAARWLGAEAMTAQGQAALEALKKNQQMRKEQELQIQAMDAFRSGAEDAITDFITGTKSAEDALKEFAASMAATFAQLIAQRWVEKLFGSMGSSGGGSSGLGGVFGAIFSGLFGKAGGGYTGAGGVNEPAGIVHRGEVVWSQADVARAGGVAAVESARRAGGGAGSSRRPQRIVIVDNQRDAEALLRSSTGEDAVLTHVRNNQNAIREILM